MRRFDYFARARLLTTAAALVLATVQTHAVSAQCPGDLNGDGTVAINEIILVINSALHGGCRAPTPTPQPNPAACEIPATGQVTSYPALRPRVGSVAVLDDGAVRAGLPARYLDNGDGTITDLNTGLMWEAKDDSGSLHDLENTYVWSGDGTQETIWDWLDAVNAEGGAGFAGRTDWRIPNINELWSLVNYATANPTAYPVFRLNCVRRCVSPACSCTIPQEHWSSTSSDEGSGYTLGFGAGYITPRLSKTASLAVRAVRGPVDLDGSSGCPLPATGQSVSYPAARKGAAGQPVPVPDDGALTLGSASRLIDNGDGTITDANTRLMWEKKDRSGGLHDAGNVYRWSGDGFQETIWDWLDMINAETHPVFGGKGFAGYSDWRIPNVNELRSVTDFGVPRVVSFRAPFQQGCASGCTVATCSCTSTSAGYWSATTYSLSSTAAYSPYSFAIEVSDKAFVAAVRAVRGPISPL